MHDYFKWFFVFRFSEVIFSFLIKKSRLKAIDIEISFFFSFPWGSQGKHSGLFLLCVTYLSELPLQTDTYINESVEIFPKLSMKTVQVDLIVGTTLEHKF